MAKHIIKCAVCGISFDTNSIQAVRHGKRRYAHYNCYPKGELIPMEVKEENPELKELKDYINELYGTKANWAMIVKQMKEYNESLGYSYSGMLKTLKYFYEVQNHSVKESNGGIGIIPYSYDAAYDYYYNLYVKQENIKDFENYTNEIEEVCIDLPQPRFKIRLFNLGEEE